MQKVYSSPDTVMAYHVANLLEQEGIECEIQGEHLAGAAGGIAPISAWVEIWIADDGRLPEARRIVDEFITGEGESVP